MPLRLLLAAVWLALGVGTAWAPGSLVLLLAGQLDVSEHVARSLAWGVVGLELGLGLGLILSTLVRALRPLGLISLLLALVGLGLVLFVDELRACACFGLIPSRAFLPKLVALGVLVYLSALVAWPKPPAIPSGRREGFGEVVRLDPSPGTDLAEPSEAGRISRLPEAHAATGDELHRPRGREHTPR